jgi:uncharacterized protein
MVTVTLLLIGLMAGAVAGLMGIGGAILIVPGLVWLLHYPQKLAQGTSLAVLLIPVGLAAVYTYYKAGNVNIHAALVLAAGFAVGGLVGASASGLVPDVVLQRGFGVLLLILAAKFLFF